MNEITQRSIDMQNAIQDDYDTIVRENAEIVVDNMLYDYKNKIRNILVQYEIDGDSDRFLIDLDYWLDFTRDNISLD
jgi:hypothetical protein